MKKITLILILITLISSCGDDNLVNTNSQKGIGISGYQDANSHPWEFIVNVVDNNGNTATQNFCVYRTQDNSVHGCGTNQPGSWWAANVDEIQWPQTQDEIIPNLIYGVEYKLQTSPNDHSDVLIFKFISAGNPDSYFRFNVDTGRLTIISLGENVEARIVSGKR